MAFLNERNIAIYDKRINERKTYRALAKEYNLSLERIRQICKKMSLIRFRQSQAINDIAEEVTKDAEQTKTLNWINFVEKYNDIPKNILVRLFNCIYRTFFHGDLAVNAMSLEERDYIILEKIKTITPEECAKMRNCGYKTFNAIMKIQKQELGIPETLDEPKPGPSVYSILLNRYGESYSDQVIRLATNSIYREYCSVDDFKKNIYDLEWFMNTIKSLSFIDMYKLRGCGIQSVLFLQDVVEKEKLHNETPIS